MQQAERLVGLLVWVGQEGDCRALTLSHPAQGAHGSVANHNDTGTQRGKPRGSLYKLSHLLSTK